MKKSELEGLIRGICPPIRQYTDDAVAKLAERIARLEGRVDEQRAQLERATKPEESK